MAMPYDISKGRIRMSKCIRCGRNKRNDSELCFECNEEWQKYMRDNPLKTYSDFHLFEIENDKRWNNFINEEKESKKEGD